MLNATQDRSRRLSGKIALVTGGMAGIGHATVRRFVEEGARVFVLDIAGEPQALAAEFRESASLILADVSDPESWERVAATVEAETGRLDCLVNCAAIFKLGTINNEGSEDFDRFFAVNQKGPLLAIKYLLPLMQKSSAGSIVNVSSGAAMSGFTGALGYMTSKWGLRGASLSLARELAPMIRVNCVFPGLISTAMAAQNPAERNAAFAEQAPLKRIGRPEEVAAAIAFLASDEASYITGCEVKVDGGICA